MGLVLASQATQNQYTARLLATSTSCADVAASLPILLGMPLLEGRCNRLIELFGCSRDVILLHLLD